MVRRARPPKVNHAEAQWRIAANRCGATYEPVKGRKTGKIRASQGVWHIELASTVVNTGGAVVTITRARALAVGRGEFRFKLSPRGRLGGLAELLGMGGIRLRDPRLQRTLVARSRQRGRTSSLVRDPAISEPIVHQRLRMRFGPATRKERRAYGPDVRAVLVEAEGLVVNVDRLVSMVRLVQTTLMRLADVGAVDPSRAPEDGNRARGGDRGR